MGPTLTSTETELDEMTGNLFLYGSNNLSAFELPADFEKQVGYIIFIPGLGDGFMPVGYLSELGDVMCPKGWHVISMLLRSSYGMYGSASLQTDCEDVDELIERLKIRFQANGSKDLPNITLIGYSTGCQDIVKYLKVGKNKNLISAAIFHSPVSDREYMDTLPNAETYKEMAAKMIAEDKGNEFMPRAAWNVPITADRYSSLTGKLSEDDMFSSDLSDDELVALFAHIRIPTLWIVALEDEYIPDHVDKKKLAERFEWALKFDSEILFVEKANHALENHTSLLCQEVHRFIVKRKEEFTHMDEVEDENEISQENGKKRKIDNDDLEEVTA